MHTPVTPSRPRSAARVLCTPLVVTLLYVAVSLVAQDRYYPVSAFPMYSFVSTSRHYLIVADGAGTPIPVAGLTGLTPGMISKRYRQYVDKEARKLEVRNVDLPPESVRKVSDQIFQDMRNGARKLKKELPAKLQLIRADITFEGGKVVDTLRPVATE